MPGVPVATTATIVGVLLLMLVVSGDGSTSTSAFPFIRGASPGDSPDVPGVLRDTGVTHVRVYVEWGYAEPKLESLETNLTVDLLRANPALVDDYSARISWADADRRVYSILNESMDVIIELGDGQANTLPLYQGEAADPNVVGRDLYLAYQYRFVRAAVRRYKAVCHLYQTENELNEAWLEEFAGQRRFGGPLGAWRDFAYVTQLLATLRMAVKDEQPDALVTTNLHTDICQRAHELLLLPGFYLDALKAWEPLLDFVSLDAYPNNYIVSPLYASDVGARVAAVRGRTGKPVVVMETGYPVAADPSQQIPALNFTEALQAQYVTDVFRSVVASGASGLVYFEVRRATGIEPPPGGYTAADQEAMSMVAKLSRDDEAHYFVEWLLKKGSVEYLRTRMGPVMQSVMAGWGLLRADGSARPALDALRAAYRGT